MTELAIYLTPVERKNQVAQSEISNRRLGDLVSFYSEEKGLPSIDNVDLAIIGVDEDRHAVGNEGCRYGADAVREQLYQLFPGNYKLKIADLGNIRQGNKPEDTYFALASVTGYLLKSGIIPVIIGGSHDLTYAAYQAYKDQNKIINLAVIDNKFDLGETEGKLSSQSFLSHVILHKPNYLFNYANIGFQSYLVDPGAVELMKELFFDTCRLGVAQSNIKDLEPVLRNADLVSFDISAIRQSDAPGNGNASPNGFYGEEACQMTRYAGMSDKLSCIGFFELNPAIDRNNQTSQLLAQMIWYFIDGYYHRQNDHPLKDTEAFMKYHVQLANHSDGIVFYKSMKSDRWWMEVKCSEQLKEKFKDHYLVPCSLSDYQIACSNEVPDRWWQAYQKLM